MSIVRFTLVVPLHDLHSGDDTSFQLATDAALAPIPEWLRNDEDMIKRLSQPDQYELTACTHCFLSEYEVDEAAELLAKRQRGARKSDAARSVRGAKADLVYLANLAMWLQRLPRVGFNLVFHVRKGSEAFNREGPSRHDRFLNHPNDESHRRRITSDDLEHVKSLYSALSRIPRHCALWTACRAVTSALQMQRNEIRHLLLWIALESLFGIEKGTGEIKYRLSQRLAFFIANDRAEARELFAKAKKGYDARCKMAHGNWGPSTQSSEEALALTGNTEEFLRRALTRLLRDDETINQFCGRSRDAYLDALPFVG
jgi:hypothetical protein